MSVPLLTTKLYVPPVRPKLVSRPRLVERLNAGMGQSGSLSEGRFARKLTLVSAPAGYGKTTLLSECAAFCGWPVAWLSLDGRDNDPTRFWAYTIAALQTVRAGIGDVSLAMLHSPQPPPIETLLIDLLNEITDVPAPLVLVLDDYHVIETQAIHDALAFLLEGLPPQMHLVLSSRADPPLSFSRLRGRDQLSEIRTADLRFTAGEAAEFLNQAMGLGLSAKDVAALEARTEGWIVGLQMVALALQGTAAAGQQGSERVARFITAFTGSHRYILDYLTDQVLSQQPEEIQRFLLQTAVLDRLTGSLCDAVCFGPDKTSGSSAEASGTGQSYGPAELTADGQGILERLDAANLFIVPLDDERRWYRYHRLFADLLRSRLERTQPERVPVLHLRASDWYEANNLLPEAVGYAFAGEDFERVARLISGHALAMLEHGELATLKSWLDTLPGEMVRSHPWLCMGRAWVLVFSGQLGKVEPLLRDAADAVTGWAPSASGSTLSNVERQHIGGHLAAVRATLAFMRGDSLQTAELARGALEQLPEDDSMARSWAAMLLGLTIYSSMDADAAEQALSEAVTIGQGAGHGHVTVMALTNLAALQMDRGQLNRAAETLRDALRLAEGYADRTGRRLPGGAITHTYLGVLLCQWNHLDTALGHLRAGVELSVLRGEPLRLATAYMHLANVLQTAGDAKGALEAIDRAKQSAASSLSPWIAARVAKAEALVHLRQGDTATAARWVAAHEQGSDEYIDLFDYWSGCLLKARIDMVQGQLDEATELLAQVSEAAEAAGGTHCLIGSLVLQATVLHDQGQFDQALTVLERALSLAQPEGYVRIFVDEGEPVATLLRQVAASGTAAMQGVSQDYVSGLLTAFREPAPTHPPLVEPLNKRELEVLRLLAAGLSNQEIAEQLFLAVGTVKKYTSNIYGKLGVHSRTQAAVEARELGLL